MADPRTRILLVAAMVLAAFRFLVVPWVAQQVEQRQQLEVLTQRLDRSKGVVRSKDSILAAEAKLEAQLQETRKLFPMVSDQDQFRLEAQRTIAGIADQGGLEVSVFDWLVSGEVREAGLAFGRVSVQFDGPLQKLIAVHGQLEGSLPFAAIRQFSLNLRSPAAGPGEDTSSATVIMDLFYRPDVQAIVPVSAKAAP